MINGVVPKENLKLLMDQGETAKTGFIRRYPDRGEKGEIFYAGEDGYNGLTYNFDVGWTEPSMNAQQVAYAFFRQTFTWWGGSPFLLLLTDRSQNHCFDQYLETRRRFKDRKEHVLEHIEGLGTWMPFFDSLVLDTANFILTGKRQIPVHMMRIMQKEFESVRRDRKEYGALPATALKIIPRGDISELFDLNPRDFFLRWIKQPGGVEDMAKTHKMLFGL